jgi:probable HAF family extracellular repeat protein
MNNRTPISILLLLGVLILLVTAANSEAKQIQRIRYHYIDLGTLGGAFSSSYGINNWGQVVGFSETDTGNFQAFVWTCNKMIDLESLGSDLPSLAWSINDRGQAVGSASGLDNRRRAVLWDYAGLHELETPEGYESEAVSISRRGEIVGYFMLPDETPDETPVDLRAVYWDSKSSTELHPPQAESSVAYSINKKGDAVGVLIDFDGRFSAVLWNRKGMHELGTLGGTQSEAYWINDKGQIVGRCDLPDDTWHACLWTPQGDIVDLGALDVSYSDAWSINGGGEVVGNYYLDTYYGGVKAFIWTKKHGMQDLTELVDLPDKENMSISYATSINDFGWIAGTTSSGTACLLIPYRTGKEKKALRDFFKR